MSSTNTKSIHDLIPTDQIKLLKAQPQPGWTSPMLATLTHEQFSDPAWIYECKLDGLRAMAYRKDGETRLLTRNQIDISDNYPTLIDALGDQPSDDFIVDGEIVAFVNKVSSFSLLQQRMHISDSEAARRSPIAVFYYLFDIVHLNGYGLDTLPLRSRKQILKHKLDYSKYLRYSNHRNTHGEVFYEEACAKGWEGLIAKRADSTYQHRRSRDWLKFKCAKRQELVICGYTAPQRGRIGFGALLVGYYDQVTLRYAGKVGTGYDDAFLAAFRTKMDAIAQENSPFEEEIKEPRTTWIRPFYVGEFRFTEWTQHGKLRHPSFLGLRIDKTPGEVVREDV